MKVLRAAALVLLAALVLASCSSVAKGAVSGAIGSIAGGVGGGGIASGAVSSAVEFQSGEVLCSDSDRSMEDARFYVSKVLTPASPATKGQAEAVFISNGKKTWVNYVVNSRKATKADCVVGATLFYLPGWAEHDKIDSDTYRKSGWDLGNVTSVEYLYKNQVEIGGERYTIDYVRVPTDPIK
ncbi:MAG TPA: hypothetical protein PLB91_03775 [Spirochaetales bacterium]|nr:hypothetical protein [Spirochaetales bacterium]HRY55200.1 hypothetical protein [Spirochaetia bacterium]HRZ64602.1 hypothetical protein [Spirochaetia bacterium]